MKENKAGKRNRVLVGGGSMQFLTEGSQKASLEKGHLSRDPRGLQREPCRFLEEEHFQAEGTQALPGVCEGYQGGLVAGGE